MLDLNELEQLIAFADTGTDSWKILYDDRNKTGRWICNC